MSGLRTIAMFIGCMVAAGCSGSTNPDLSGDPSGGPAGDRIIDIVTDRQADAVSIQAEGETTLLDIVSEGGIGGADFTRAGDSWPRPLVLRFHLAGLEQLDVVYGDIHIVVSVASSPDHTVRGRLRTAGGEQAIDRDSPYWLEPRIVVKSAGDGIEYIDVPLPGDFFTGDHRGFAIDWVDFFR